MIKLAGPLSEREQYCLRKLVASFPLFDLGDVRTLTDADVAWWTAERKATVVPGRENTWFDVTLGRLLGQLRSGETASPRVRVHRPLLYRPEDGVDLARIPHNVAIFFRHFFVSDEVHYVQRVQQTFLRRDFTATHTLQVWDFVRDLWHYAVESGLSGRRPGSGIDRRRDVVPLLSGDLLWDFLLAVYRRQGGGARRDHLPARGPRLRAGPGASPCIKAMTSGRLATPDVPPPAVRTVIDLWEGPESARPAKPTRAELCHRIRLTAYAEEGCVPGLPELNPMARRTYTAAECARLLSACGTHRERLIMLLLQRVGLRNAAMRRLTLGNVTEDLAPHPPRTVACALEKGGVLRQFVLRQGGASTVPWPPTRGSAGRCRTTWPPSTVSPPRGTSPTVISCASSPAATPSPPPR